MVLVLPINNNSQSICGQFFLVGTTPSHPFFTFFLIIIFNWGITKGSTWCSDKCVQSENENLFLNFYLPLNPVLFLHLLYRWKLPPCVPWMRKRKRKRKRLTIFQVKHTQMHSTTRSELRERKEKKRNSSLITFKIIIIFKNHLLNYYYFQNSLLKWLF